MDKQILVELEKYVKDDKYGLRAETLYRNIANSMGTDEKLGEIFSVPAILVRKIKEDDIRRLNESWE